MSVLDILLASFILLAVGVGGVVKLFTRRNHRRLQRELTALSESKGWSVEETNLEGSAIRLSGKTSSDVIWEMMLAGRDRQGKEQSKWICQEFQLAEGAVLIGRVPEGVEIKGIEEELTPDEMRAEFFWKQVEKRLGEDAPEGVQPFEVGSLSFREHFVVLALDRVDAETLLTHDVEEALLEWRKVELKSSVPLVFFTEDGLELLLHQVADTPSIQRVVALGERILEIWK